VTALLLERLGDQIQVTKGVIKAAAGNGRKGKELMALLLGHLGRQIQIEDHELQTAAWKGNIESVEHLLVNGASAASANRCGWTPLNAASWNGDIQVVGLLLAKGAHPTAKSNIGWTPLDAAFAKGRVDTVRLLLPHDPDAAADFTPTSFSDVRKSGVLELDGDKLEVRYVRPPNKGK
jgi:ankyrin repeat protein